MSDETETTANRRVAAAIRERDEARAEVEYLKDPKTPRPLTPFEERLRASALKDGQRVAEDALGAELDRQRVEKRAWNIDANNLKAEVERLKANAAKARRLVAEAVEFLERRYGNDDGNDWSDEPAAHVADSLDEAAALLEPRP